MSKLARALALAAMLAAMSLAGMTAAQAQATDHPTRQDARRPPTESQVGEYWRDRPAASQEQAGGDATTRRLLARERFSVPDQGPAQAASPQPAQPGRQADWLIPALGVLATVVALAAVVAVLASRRATRTRRASQTA
jgi:CHASE1-domain containing sensor protein